MDNDTPMQFDKGDTVSLWITGCVGTHEARCTKTGFVGSANFEITDDPSWVGITLKPGDYIVKSRTEVPA